MKVNFGTVFRTCAPMVLTIMVFITLWQALSWSGRFPPTLLVSPHDVGITLAELAGDGTLYTNLLASLRRTALGIALGGSAGIVFGCLCGTSNAIWRQVAPLFTGMRQIPIIATGPLLIIILGINEYFIILMLALAAFFPMALAVIDGIHNVPSRYIEVAAILRIGPLDRLRLLFLPAIAPSIATGCRVALNRCWGLVVAAELFGASSGLGQMMNWAREMFQINVVMAGAITAAVTAVLLDALLRAGAWYFLKWERP